MRGRVCQAQNICLVKQMQQAGHELSFNKHKQHAAAGRTISIVVNAIVGDLSGVDPDIGFQVWVIYLDT